MKRHKFYFRDKIKISVKKIVKKALLKSIQSNLLVHKTARQRAINKMTIINGPFNLNKLKKFCIMTGRLRFIMTNSKYSRIIFREYVGKGLLTGFRKNG